MTTAAATAEGAGAGAAGEVLGRPIFDPVNTSFDPREHATVDHVESPSLTSGNALARFEFEPGKSKDGTKVLMVEWEDDDTTKNLAGVWELSWDGKRTVLPAKDQQSGAAAAGGDGDGEGDGGEQPINRLYFLLGPGVSVPTSVRLQKGEVAWRTNPLPAIFPPELGATARQAGKRGVLHTVWAKKRLQVLTREIAHESKENVEGIGLEMAVAEKEWIEQNFGVVAKPDHISINTQPSMATIMGGGGINSPTSPRSPGGGRLLDKLKGLKIGTSEQQLSGRESAAPASGESSQAYHNPLSPETSDVAVGSFGSFAALKGAPPPSTLAAKPAQTPADQQQQQQQPRKIAAQRPPEFLQRQQQEAGMASLNAFASGAGVGSGAGPEEETGDDLFALPMSPRSPEMAKSPFSFASQDTTRYLKGEPASSS